MHQIPSAKPPFSAVGVVNVIMNHDDSLIWDTHFEPQHTEGYHWGTIEFSEQQPIGEYWLEIDQGGFQFTIESGTLSASHPVHIALQNPVDESTTLLHSLTALGESFSIDIPEYQSQPIRIYQDTETTVTVRVEKTYQFISGGQNPIMMALGHHLSVSWQNPWDSFRPGVITAKARLYSVDGDLLDTSDELVLSMTGQGTPPA